jgi:hypothetical protein
MESFFERYSKLTFVNFKKLKAKILDVYDVELYLRIKYQFKI